MAGRSELEAAVAAGVIQADQVGPLTEFLAKRDDGVRPPASGEEDLRFIRNFHDVFLAIGIVLLAVGLGVAIASFASGAAAPQEGALRIGGGSAGAAVLMWVLGELFARRRRLFLPAIAIVLSLTVFAVGAALSLYGGLVLGREIELNFSDGEVPMQVRVALLIAAGFGVIAPLAFYLRFRLPFSLGLTGAGWAGFIIVSALIYNMKWTWENLALLYVVLGLLLFVAGVVFDARDPERATRFSDNGFWLHFAAAPLILNGTFGLIGQLFRDQSSPIPSGMGGLMMAAPEHATTQAALTLIVVLLLGFVSLLINRRVLIVSALLTTGVAIGVLLNAAGLGAGALAASTLITLGAFVLILGAGWRGVRRTLLGWVKPDGMWARIFPPESAPA